jgi:DNA invertase Pin-like site-specific DNA recombinase
MPLVTCPLIFMATILYARVSTAEQTMEHQAAQARAASFNLDEVVADNGVSGLSTRLTERPEGRRLYDKPSWSAGSTA